MKILHVTPHLGGGVGKAHAALSPVLPEVVEQTFVLLEPPRDRRYLEAIEAAGARIVVAGDLAEVAPLARAADIVQFEFWNHPRLFECLARCKFPGMRSVFWSHISGLYRPLIQPGLMAEAARFVFTSEASLSIPWAAAPRGSVKPKLSVINSGFGFAKAPQRKPEPGRVPTIAYLGTVDFVKMHPGFFDAVDQLVGGDIRISVWGAADDAVVARAQAMRHRERVHFCGETADPAAALADADIFFYPLQPDHFGTAENTLIEAMSLGLTPVVLDNPAERAIVRDSETGFVAHNVAECVSLLQKLLVSPDLRDRISANAVRCVAENLTPARSALEFMILWLGLIGDPAKQCDFRAVIGDSPADWYLATQCLPGAAWVPPAWQADERPAKGSLAHFESVFAGDESFGRLRRLHTADQQQPAPKPERIRA
jgi:glycosyltransferase involved in cell wall biosynthesis